MPRGQAVDDARRTRILQALAEGVPQASIAARFGLNVKSIERLAREARRAASPRPDGASR